MPYTEVDPRSEVDSEVGSDRSEAQQDYEPVWGSDGWPRPCSNGLDEGDQLLLRSMLALSPLERLQTLSGFIGVSSEIRRAEQLRSD